MKRLLLLFLSVFALLLAACGTSAPAESPTPGDGEQPAVITDAAATPATNSTLFILLDALRDGVQPGTAGSSLKAAIVAADLLDWAKDPPPQDSVSLTVRDWLAAQSEDALALLPEQLSSLTGTVEQLVGDYEASQGLLEDAGLTGRGPWSAEVGAQALALLLALQPVD